MIALFKDVHQTLLVAAQRHDSPPVPQLTTTTRTTARAPTNDKVGFGERHATGYGTDDDLTTVCWIL